MHACIPGTHRCACVYACVPICLQVDTTGLGIILMDYLVAREWVGEAEIVDNLKVHPKLLRRGLKYLERVRGG